MGNPDVMLKALLGLDVEPGWEEVGPKAIAHCQCRDGHHFFPCKCHSRPRVLGV